MSRRRPIHPWRERNPVVRQPKQLVSDIFPSSALHLLISREVSVPSRTYSSTPLKFHPRSCTWFTLITLKLGLVFTRFEGQRVFTGKSPKQPRCTTSSSSYRPPLALSIVPSRWRMEGKIPSDLLAFPETNSKSHPQWWFYGRPHH